MLGARAHVPRGPAVDVLRSVVGLEQAREPRALLRIGNELVGYPRSLSDSHDLEEPRRHSPVPREARECLELVLVLSAHHDDVELRLGERECGHGLDAGEDRREAPSAREAGEPLGIERVERDVDAHEPRRVEGRGELGEACAVRGEGDVVEPDLVQRPHRVDDDGGE
jgi:hypothetical protein